jgi:hypothetical protein
MYGVKKGWKQERARGTQFLLLFKNSQGDSRNNEYE